ncbi:hypothetical protein B0A52_08966 [Exophiala mesophila]|uniref:alpha-amylase n=1 Tax=Exophiala mesophila TaxID=212818 RepID=A0A438MUI3_EXOME|nr:hypothetical protein B0A52_08966 [Exophiala mesophila]
MQRLSSFARSLSGGGKTNGTPNSDSIPQNQIIFQGFEWHLPGPEKPEQPSHWTLLKQLLPHLSALGVSHIWLPPGCKSTNVHDNGYGIYDLWDLGEFEAKGSRRTKWGVREELDDLCKEANRLGIAVLWDAVLNHKAAADGKETSNGIKVDPRDRNRHISPQKELETWTSFNFPARGNQYSNMKYNWKHFSGVDYDSRTKDHGIFSHELGNYDYLMFADLDHSHPEVRKDIFDWGTWITTALGLGGMRLDAIKHYSLSFLKDLISHLDLQNKNLFFIGEYWVADSKILQNVLRAFNGRISLFDVQLVYNLSDYSQGRKTDLRNVLQGSLSELDPRHAVTFVANHDTQESQSLAAPVEEWFVPLAHSLILLRQNCGIPCVFWGDVFGINGPRPRLPACGGKLARLIAARKLLYWLDEDGASFKSKRGWSRCYYD